MSNEPPRSTANFDALVGPDTALIQRAMEEIERGMLEVKQHLLLRAFKDGTLPREVRFEWAVEQSGIVRCGVAANGQRRASEAERAEIELRMKEALKL